MPIKKRDLDEMNEAIKNGSTISKLARSILNTITGKFIGKSTMQVFLAKNEQ